MLPANRMLTDEQAAAYCGFSSVNGFKAHIQVAPVNFGRLVRYDIKDLDEYLDRHRQSAPVGDFAELAGAGGEDRGR